MHKLWKYLFDEDTGRGIALTTLFYQATYRKTYQFAKHIETWTAEQIKEYQWKQLSALLHHAYEYVPYYHTLFKTHSITPDDIRSFEEFRDIPLLGKETVQAHVNDLKATNYPANAFEETNTGGSTGFSLQFYVERGVWFAKHLAYISVLLGRSGTNVMENSVQIIGREKPWEYRPLTRTLVLSSYQMTDQNLPVYVKKIQELHPGYFIGYPSAITMLASYMKHHSIEVKGVKAVHLFGETIYDWQREFLESFFHCRVHGQYGHREQCVLSGTCETANTYHLFPDYGYAELVDRNGNPITKEQQCECGRQVQLLKSVEGRIQDFMVSHTGRLVPLMGVLQLISRSSSHMKEYQLYQDREGELVLRIIKKEGFSEQDVHQIKENIRTRLGDEFSLSIEYLDMIPRTIRGKYQFFVQKLPVKYILE